MNYFLMRLIVVYLRLKFDLAISMNPAMKKFSIFHQLQSVLKVKSRWFANEDNILMLQKMEAYGVNLTQTDDDKPLQVSEDGVFYGSRRMKMNDGVSCSKREERIGVPAKPASQTGLPPLS